MFAYHTDFAPACLAIYRQDIAEPLIVQHAAPHHRPFIHPLRPPDGVGVLTEDAPAHHPWQHGLYTGLNDVNGVGFWCEGLYAAYTNDGSFAPQSLELLSQDAEQVRWQVITDWLAPDRHVMLQEQQRWTVSDYSPERYRLRLEWQLTAHEDLRFGQYAYGGLFLRMPYRKEKGGRADADRRSCCASQHRHCRSPRQSRSPQSLARGQ